MQNLPRPSANQPLIPWLTWTLDVPQRPADMAKRYHNQYAKAALKYALEMHHQHHIPLHFKRGNRDRYDHEPRDHKYIRWKQKVWKKGGMDLVKRGRTRQKMTSQYKLRAGGSATGGNLNATLILNFPFKGGSGRFRKSGTSQAVQIQQMVREIQTFNEDEIVKIAEWWGDEYFRLVEAHRSRRKRTRYS